MVFKIENWKGKKVYVERNKNGSILSYRNVKGSKLTKETAQEKYKVYKTFKDDEIKESVRLTHLTEISIFSKSKKAPSMPKRKRAQFVCECDFKGQHFAARSFKVGSPSALNSSAAKKQARNSLQSQLSQEINEIYEPDPEIIYTKGVTNYREGWVYYVKN